MYAKYFLNTDVCLKRELIDFCISSLENIHFYNPFERSIVSVFMMPDNLVLKLRYLKESSS